MEAPRILDAQCQRCKAVIVLSPCLEIHINTTFDLPPGLRIVTSVQYIEADKLRLIGVCATCYGPCVVCKHTMCSSCGLGAEAD